MLFRSSTLICMGLIFMGVETQAHGESCARQWRGQRSDHAAPRCMKISRPDAEIHQHPICDGLSQGSRRLFTKGCSFHPPTRTMLLILRCALKADPWNASLLTRNRATWLHFPEVIMGRQRRPIGTRSGYIASVLNSAHHHASSSGGLLRSSGLASLGNGIQCSLG